ISLFCYETAPVGELLNVLAESPKAIRLHVAPGKPLAAVRAHLGESGPWQRGHLSVLPFDFLSQDDFDRLLWRCEINFVRGEDSFVRAQWAGQAFVWQIYRQEENAHLVKLTAFLERYTQGLSATGRNAAVDLFKSWNSGGDLRQAWAAFLRAKPEITEHNRRWADQLAENPDLAKALVKFCEAKV
ncbi:MAG TPA: elongation factor P maturation arginine rhamnosyltransferase EarP, partial [Azonexus sp.]|nr:elongation factor P maturation arginine rhamnosyltransferase EarP [Azonexus sp.]